MIVSAAVGWERCVSQNKLCSARLAVRRPRPPSHAGGDDVLGRALFVGVRQSPRYADGCLIIQ